MSKKTFPYKITNPRRRTFLKRSSATLAAAACAPGLGGLFASAAGATTLGEEKILVVLELSGGNDGLNTVVHKPVYLDYNATTPIDPRVLQKMLPYLQHDFGNA